MVRFWCQSCRAKLTMVERVRPDGSRVTTHLVRGEGGEYDCGPVHRIWWESADVERESVG